MTFEEEMEQLQNEALNELEEDNDTNENDSDEEQSDGDTDIDEGLEDNSGEDDSDKDRDDSEDDTDEHEEDDTELEEEEEEEDTKEELKNSEFDPIEVTINGTKISLESREELQKYLSNNQTKKTRKRTSKEEQLMQQSGLNEADIQLMVDAKKGNKAALAKLAKDSGVDLFDIEESLASEYKPGFQPSYMSEVDEIANEILEDKELYPKFESVIRTVPQDFVSAISSDASALEHFAGHVRSGLAERIIPLAIKESALNGSSFLESYAKIGRGLSTSTQEVEPVKEKRKVNPRANELKKRASKTKGSGAKKSTSTADDIWSMSSEDFENLIAGD